MCNLEIDGVEKTKEASRSMNVEDDWSNLTPFQKLAFAVNEVWGGKGVRMCIKPGCDRPAGTPWTRLLCWQHDDDSRKATGGEA